MARVRVTVRVDPSSNEAGFQPGVNVTYDGVAADKMLAFLQRETKVDNLGNVTPRYSSFVEYIARLIKRYGMPEIEAATPDVESQQILDLKAQIAALEAQLKALQSANYDPPSTV